MHNFDEVISRRHTSSVKWGSQDDRVIPMWIADMDFKTSEAVITALEERVKHGIFGYASLDDDYYQAEMSWWKERHNTEIKKEWIEVTTGIIPALSSIVYGLCQPGDQVIIQNPVYNYFESSVRNNGCDLLINPLIYKNNSYEIDYEHFEMLASQASTKLFILCNPHNPVGRVWTEQELRRLGNICLKHQVIVVVDEAHRDLVLEGKHKTFISIDDDFKMNSVTCTSPGKSFNLAGLKVANIITANPEFRKKINKAMNIKEVIEPNIFGIQGLIAAYQNGHDWLDDLLEVLKRNKAYVKDFVNNQLPEVKMVELQGTYLVWLDCHRLGVDDKVLSEKLLDQAHLRITPGSVYGQGGQGFIRMNIACPFSTLKEGLDRLYHFVKSMR